MRILESESDATDGGTDTIEALDEATRAWRIYEESVDWDTDVSGDHPDMDSDEYYDVWNAMKGLDEAIEREKAQPGSAFADDVPVDERVRLTVKAMKAQEAYRAFRDDAGYREKYAFTPFEPFARKVSEAFEIPFVGRHGSGEKN